MRKKTLLELAFLSQIGFGGLFLEGCYEDFGIALETSRLFPISVGNHWSFIQSAYISGVVVDSLADSIRIDITRELSISFGGQSYQASVWSPFDIRTNRPTEYQWLFWNGNEGLYEFGGLSNSDTLITKFLYLKSPVIAGSIWQVPNLVYMFDTGKFVIQDALTYDCAGVDQSIDTPAGAFRCTVFHDRIRPQPDVLEYWDYYQYYAADVGLVAIIVKSSLDGSIKFKTLLFEFSVRQ